LQDGNDFLEEVSKKGVAVIYTETKPKQDLKVPYVLVPNARLKLAELASRFYGNPSHGMIMVGVTGTSGKTTTTFLIESILKNAGHKVGIIGTINIRFGKKIYEASHTTPDPVQLQELLDEMKKDGCTAVVMEVSSHALKQCRVDFVEFDVAVFKNLTPEHLDFHSDMEDYFQSKKILFTRLLETAKKAKKQPVAVINEDDSYGKRLVTELKQMNTNVRSYSQSSNNVIFTIQGISGKIGNLPVESKLVGAFNGLNISAAVEVGHALNVKKESIQKGISEVTEISGRLQKVPSSGDLHVFVDYAHKPDALEKVLSTLQDLKKALNGKIITVFGCGGDRDRTKRPKMGQIAAQCSDVVIVTSDNPRTEDPQKIIDEILMGMTQFKNFSVQADREKAIYAAINCAKKDDIVLIAGKGHEDYQILGTRKIHFDDREVADRALTLRSKSL
jgi:UDP-N-acetylmuramyl-tripeptide synthetase